MTESLLPGAVWRPVSYRAEAGAFSTAPIGWILHVVVGNGSPWGTFEHAPAGSRKFSHGWVAKDGRGEQYAELTGKSWAQGAGNPLYWAFETEGYPTEPLTDAQIETLARWHNTLGAADALAEAPGQRGIGTHYMGGSAWGGHTCPDPSPGAGPRSHQRGAIVARAQALRGPLGGFGTGVGGSGTYTPLPSISTPATPAPVQEDDMPTLISSPTHGAAVLDGGRLLPVGDQATVNAGVAAGLKSWPVTDADFLRWMTHSDGTWLLYNDVAGWAVWSAGSATGIGDQTTVDQFRSNGAPTLTLSPADFSRFTAPAAASTTTISAAHGTFTVTA